MDGTTRLGDARLGDARLGGASLGGASLGGASLGGASLGGTANWPLALLLGVWLVVPGCRQQPVAESVLKSSQQAYDNALAAYTQADFATAREQLNVALQDGGLDADCYVDALAKRAVCAAAANDFQSAQTDLTEAEAGASDMSIIHAAKGFILAKQGDRVGAKAEFDAAKAINPQVEIPQVD